MANAAIVSTAEKLTADKDWPLANPWPWLLAGLVSAGLSLGIVRFFHDSLASVRVILVFAGVLAALAAVAIRPSSPWVLFGAGLTSFVGAWALYRGSARDPSWIFLDWLPEEWNSIRWFLAMGAVVAIVAAGIVALPRLWRRVAMSVVILLHFGGILTAVLSASPSPWLANLMMGSVYRRYLQFMYLTNAYHFYAPDPGNSYFFWFRVAYTRDGDTKNTYWKLIKVPHLEEGWPQYPLGIQYQRRLAMAALLAQKVRPLDPIQEADTNRRHEKANLERYRNRKPIFPIVGPHNYMPLNPGYAVFLQSFVRYTARKFETENPNTTITGIKVYRVEHVILNAAQLAAGEAPEDPHTYFPYFWGEFTTDGELKNPEDPFLYWLMPILKVKPVQAASFPPNVEILKPLAENMQEKYLKKYVEDAAKKMPELLLETAGDPGVVNDFNDLLDQPRVPLKAIEAFEKKYPRMAGKTSGFLADFRKQLEKLKDIGGLVKKDYPVPEEAKLLLLLADINSLLSKHPGLMLDLINHRGDLLKNRKGNLVDLQELAQILQIWNAGRLRVPRDEEDHFDIAVLTATSALHGDPVILNYTLLHGGDSKWVRYPGKAEYEELRPN